MVREGYKQTEVGVIPEDWETWSLKQLTLDMVQGVNTAVDRPEYVHDGIPMLKANNIIDGEVVFEGADHISQKTFLVYSDRFKLKKNDFLFSNIGARLGTGSLLKCDVACSFAWNVMRIVPNIQKITPEYLCFLINSPKHSQRIKSKQSGSGMGFVPKGVMKDLVVAVPSTLEEQRSIAQALSDVDALIAGLDKAITKKRAIKTATMQQLLTGKKRLPGFGEEWIEKQLNEVATITMGQSPSSAYYNTKGVGLPLIQGNADIRSRQAIIRNYTSQITKRCYAGDIILSVRAPVGEVARANFDACIGRGVCAISYPNNFLYQFLLFIEPQWSKLSKGSTFDSVNSDEVSSLGIRLPEDLEEQHAIATVFSDMDTEIAALETRLAKTQSIKQGMMQQLLMGKVRLKIEG